MRQRRFWVTCVLVLVGVPAFAQTAPVGNAPPPSPALMASQFVADGLALISAYSLPLLIAFAAVGLVTMALIQAVKDVFPVRREFHRRRIDAWLMTRGGDDHVRKTLIELSAGGNDQALFEMPIASMMGQLTMASRVVLMFPNQYQGLLLVMAGLEIAADIRTIVVGPNDSSVSRDAVDEARVRVGHMVERNIDALQISVASRWERENKIAAFIVSALVTAASFVVYFYANERSPVALNQLFALGAVTSILAGFVAPVAKDLVTALQNLKKA